MHSMNTTQASYMRTPKAKMTQNPVGPAVKGTDGLVSPGKVIIEVCPRCCGSGGTAGNDRAEVRRGSIFEMRLKSKCSWGGQEKKWHSNWREGITVGRRHRVPRGTSFQCGFWEGQGWGRRSTENETKWRRPFCTRVRSLTLVCQTNMLVKVFKSRVGHAHICALEKLLFT